jgi:hypothetical protein
MNKEYLRPGDIVRFRHELPHRPLMVVEEISKVAQPTGRAEVVGIICAWFGPTYVLHREKFNFKDLELCSRDSS